MSEDNLLEVLISIRATDEAYRQYKNEQPESELSREDFRDMVLDGDGKWGLVTNTLINYMSKTD